MKDVMIDIETLGTRTTSAIVQIGACYFNRENGDIGRVFEMNIKVPRDMFTIDYSTIQWWLTQSPEAQQAITLDPQPLALVIDDLAAFLNEATYIWSHATFDVPILLNTFDKLDRNFPIHYTKMRDIRTLMDITKHKSVAKRAGIHHTALDDCRYQVEYCVEALNKLKV